MLVSLLFGCVDAVKLSSFQPFLPGWIAHLPLSTQGLAWLPPTLAVSIIVALYDKYGARREFVAH